MNIECNELMNFIDNSVTQFHAVENVIEELKKNGFEKLESNKNWNLKIGGKYYTTKNNSSIIAFIYGKDTVNNGFRIIASHSDSPSLRLKPNTEVRQNDYIKLNVEVYGGPIANTWFDRPLGIAGRVMTKGENVMKPKTVLFSYEEAVAIIPNLAIHMQRGKDSENFSKQRDLQAIISGQDKDFSIKKSISEKMGIDEEAIIDYDLFLYEYTKSSYIGINKEWISAPRLDNLSMAHASLEAIKELSANEWTSLLVVFDNEEVGNRTKQGAASPWLKYVLERIILSQSKNREDYFIALDSSFMLSSDLAHAIHPNRPEKHDPNNHPKLNKGPVIKVSANQAYTSDAESISVFESICNKNSIPYQKFVNHSDQPGGSTIGPTNSTQLPIRSVDIGNPCLAMHSTRELVGDKDHGWMISAMKSFYESK